MPSTSTRTTPRATASRRYMRGDEAGVDVVDARRRRMSGLTCSRSLIVAGARAARRRATPASTSTRCSSCSNYWEEVRSYYAPFESGLNAPAADVYVHEMPGGQYSNLRAQAEALGLGDALGRVKRTYADVNQLFGDIVKVTPSSKVVGDMASVHGREQPDARRTCCERAARADVSRVGRSTSLRGRARPAARRLPRAAAEDACSRGRQADRGPPRRDAAAGRLRGDAQGASWRRWPAPDARRDVVSYLLYPQVLREFVAHQRAVRRRLACCRRRRSSTAWSGRGDLRSRSSRARR